MAEYKDIEKQIKLGQFAPIYLLMGEEPYFIDKLTELLESSVLTEDEKFMNLGVHYGKDSRVSDIINEARQYPTMASRRLVMLKEAQTLDKKNDLDLLEHYLQKPAPTTVVVISYKYGTVDKRKKWVSAASKIGVVFTSEKIRDYKLAPFIETLAKSKGLSIEPDAASMMAEMIGSDLKLLESTIDKLKLQLADKKTISANLVAASIGISKDYTPFELLESVINRDIAKSIKICHHTTSAIQQTIAVLFNYFCNLMIYHYLADKSKENAVAKLKINPYFLKDYVKGTGKFTKMQTFKTIGLLREYDGKSKGVGNNSAESEQLLEELVLKICYA